MSHGIIQLAYLIATALFIFALHWMNTPATARKGVYAGVAATTLAIVVTWAEPSVIHHVWIVLAIVAGFVVGLVGTAEYYLRLSEGGEYLTPFRMVALISEIILGYLTFTGSLMAAGKLQEVRWVPQRPVTYPAQNVINVLLLGIAVALGVGLTMHPTASWAPMLFPVIIALALLFGVLLII